MQEIERHILLLATVVTSCLNHFNWQLYTLKMRKWSAQCTLNMIFSYLLLTCCTRIWWLPKTFAVFTKPSWAINILRSWIYKASSMESFVARVTQKKRAFTQAGCTNIITDKIHFAIFKVLLISTFYVIVIIWMKNR